MEKKLWLYYSVLLKLFFWEPSALWMVTMNSTYIHCHTYMFLLQIRKNMVELYFVKRGHPVDFFDVDKDLIPTTDIRNRNLLEYLQKRIPSMNITIETSQVCYVWSLQLLSPLSTSLSKHVVWIGILECVSHHLPFFSYILR